MLQLGHFQTELTNVVSQRASMWFFWFFFSIFKLF